MRTNHNMLNKKQQIEKMISLPTIVLAAEEADQFIDYIVDESILKQNARVVKMNKPTKEIRALGLGSSRFLKPGATFSSSYYLKTLSHDKITLTAVKVRGAVAIFDDDLEDNIEGDAFADHVMRMVAGQIANELDEAFWIADAHSLGGFAATDIRSIWDGWRYRITHAGSGETYENDVSGSPTLLDATSAFSLAGKIAQQNGSAPYNWEFKYSKALKSLPSKYKSVGLANLRFFSNDIVSQDYVESLSERSTILGDNAILGTAPLTYGKVPIVDCPNMSDTLGATGIHGGGSYTDTLLTPKNNLIVGIQRDIKIESQREAADEATYWFYSMRADLAIENVNACVLIHKLTHG